MKSITIIYVLNAMLLLLHEIESAYQKEWEMLKIPGKVTGFIIFHVPIILILFYGVLEIEKLSQIGLIIGVLTGIGGLIPFIVHKIIFPSKDYFNLLISNIIIYLNILTGLGTFLFSLYCLRQ